MDLVLCIYCSAAAKDFTPDDLARLLTQCRENNAQKGLTGMLVYSDNTFFQVLEGDRPVVEALLQKLASDPRHGRITKLIVESIEQRSFNEWTMGYARVGRRELADIPGLNDFFSQGRSLLELDDGRAKKLLGAFKDGAWRQSLS